MARRRWLTWSMRLPRRTMVRRRRRVQDRRSPVAGQLYVSSILILFIFIFV
jgi:hypothetical protein